MDVFIKSHTEHVAVIQVSVPMSDQPVQDYGEAHWILGSLWCHFRDAKVRPVRLHVK